MPLANARCRRRVPALEECEPRFCPDGTSLVTLGSGSGFTFKMNDTGRVAVMQISPAEYAAWQTGSQSYNDDAAMAKRVYQFLPDNYDFLYFVNNEATTPPGAGYIGASSQTRNDVQGIGSSIYSNDAAFGSTGQLRAFLHFTNLDGLQNGPTLHEMLHDWGNYLSDIPNNGAHWGFSSVGGQLGGWKPGTLTSLGGNKYDADGYFGTSFGTVANGGNAIPYAPLELYLMGLVDKSAVSPIQVAVNGSFASQDDANNGIFTADSIKTVTIDDIISHEGVRVPDVADSQKSFRGLAVLLTPTAPTTDTLSKLDNEVNLFGKPGDDGTFYYNFWEATGGRATLKMDGNLPAPSLAISDATVTEGDTGSTTASFQVKLSYPALKTVTVHYATANGTAGSADYSTAFDTLTFAPGDQVKTVKVAVTGDKLDENNETFFVNLSNATGATVADAQGKGTIVDNDPTPYLTISDATVTEGTGTTVNDHFTVMLSAASALPVTVKYATATNTAGSKDFKAASGTLTFAPGETAKGINVAVIGDALDEAKEAFVVNLSSATNATIHDGRGVGTIIDNDPTPKLTVSNVTVTEPKTGSVLATFTIHLSAASGQTVTLTYATSNGTATAPADYTALASTKISFAPGQTTKTVSVKVKSDAITERNETFFLLLTNPINAVISVGKGTGAIRDASKA